MTIKKSMIRAVLTLGILGACTEKNKKEDHNQQVEEVKEEVASKVKETVSKEEKRKADSILRVEDSIRQVKEHGHVH